MSSSIAILSVSPEVMIGPVFDHVAQFENGCPARHAFEAHL